jgi:hypothetical protein
MLTSPVHVTIAASGTAIKANTAASDHSARREVPLPISHQALPAEDMIEPELPSHSPLTSVNAVTATVGNRTILQELSISIASMLKIARRPEENLTALFLRVIARIEAMPQAERLQFEVRTGLKPLKITLSDLLMALRKPDGLEAARLTAIAEAPTAMPGRTAANAATTTYLEEGTESGHTEETLAMRAAARHSAAGQSVFSAESKVRPDAQPTDAKVLQNHLKTMFEPGETSQPAEQKNVVPQEAAAARDLPVANDQAVVEDMNAKMQPEAPAMPVPKQPQAALAAKTAEDVHFSSANLKLDPLTVERIRDVAQSLAALAETVRAEQQRAAPEKAEDRRLQTMLTLKGLAEVVSAIPAKAAELLAAVVAEAAAPLPELADETSQLPGVVQHGMPDEAQVSDMPQAFDEVAAENVADAAPAEETTAEIPSEESTLAAEQAEAQPEVVVADEFVATLEADAMPLARSESAPHGLPFVAAQVQPGREELVLDAEEETRGDTDEEDEGEDDEDGERRRPRDEYDAIHDELPEEDPVIVITRDSSEADRAFAMYQRMGGF